MKNVVIIGAGPAGLTAAYTLLKESSEYHPIIVEASEFIGGISRTARYKGNRIDIGGHRFFSKDKEIMKMWMDILPLQGSPSKDDIILGRTHTHSDDPSIDPEKIDDVFLARTRVSRIYFRRRFFDYPISLKPQTFINMGFVNTVKAGFGYLGSVFHKLPETSLENFYINRFGKPLYQMFFEDYTEKLWGVHPSNIAADWGAQRVKGLSVWKVITSALSKPFRKKDSKVETSLIEEFYYPKYGPGQLWEKMADICTEKGAELKMQYEVVKVTSDSGRVTSVTVRNTDKNSPDFGKEENIACDYLISSMAIKDLVEAIPETPQDIYEIAVQLPYRDFITVGLLLDKLEIKNKTKMKTINDNVPDCWIYIQERNVKLGRLQIFNNWSPYMVDDMNKHIWVGLEYFCNEGDDMWNTPPEEFIQFAAEELEKIGVIKRENIVDSFTTKVKKAYPAYFGTYAQFDKVKDYLDSYENMFCVGRNGQHRYNNMDHSMLTAINAARSIISGSMDKDSVWNVNTEKEYHETKTETENNA
ncbi:MAG: NAD(P)/FAD-dependent oxidoreductase [Oscillospiraceae bacterium]|nr:NAD(P)/FAD-dependent oxidoreductase [Oscillospiraceae bacterium]